MHERLKTVLWRSAARAHSPCTRWRRVQIGRAACCTTRTPHMRCRAPCHNPILRLSTAQVMFVTRNPLHVIGIPLSASDGSCSRHPNDGDARAHHKECCTPRLPRVHVKRIACINGPTNACQPQTRGRRVGTDCCVDERPRSPHHARAILRV